MTITLYMRKKFSYVSEINTSRGIWRMAMNRFLITYDLKKTSSNDRSSDYNKLYEKLSWYNKNARVTESSWIIKTYKPAREVYDNLASVLNSGDSIFITAICDPALWYNCLTSDEKIKEVLN